MEENTPKLGLYFMNAGLTPPCFVQVEPSIASLTNVEFKAKLSIDDILYEAKSGKKCIVFLTIGDRNDLAVVANGLFALKKEIRERKVIASVFMKFASDKVEELLMRSGCNEILKYDVNAKALLYKIRRHIKVLEQEEVLPDVDVSVFGDKGGAPADAGKTLGSGRHSSAPAFQVELTSEWPGDGDFWLFRKKVYAKKYQSFWMIEIIGPSPSAGSWESLGDDRWQWRSRPGFDFFDVTPGNWEFKGREPQYSWVINRWAFVSENPYLNLIKAGQVVYSRFHLRDPNTLEVPNNSEYARSIFQKIKDTYDKDYLLEAEKKNFANLEGIFGPNAEVPWADKTNSKDLSAADWVTHDLKPEASRDWNRTPEPTDFLMGAEAMRDCGLKGKVKNYDVELLEYNEVQSTISVGLDAALVEYKETIEVTVVAENLDLPKGMKLKGIVTHIEPEDELGKTVVVVLMLQNSKEEFRKIRNAVDKRQAEVFSFFKKVKGLE